MRPIPALALAASLLLTGCADLGYYWQSASGHIGIMRAAKPVPEWLSDPAVSAPLKARLELTQRIRRFASSELGLPDNPSYTSYADLHRAAAVWNVVAAPPYSLTLKNWCFPVAGCVGYRGYYSEDAAKAEAEAQKKLDLEVAVYPVPAYSTLGWMNWAGGDPLLSTFIGYPEGELARIVFHELAHQVLYVPGDTVFNESYATSVERIGGAMWLQREAGEAARAEYTQFDAQRQGFRALALDTRRALTRVYESPEAKAGDRAKVEAMKQAAMAEFRQRYAQLKAGWTGPRQNAYDGWVARANNAAFGAQGAYDDLVPSFEKLFDREGHDWPRFYTEVKRIAALPTAEERRGALQAATGILQTRSSPHKDDKEDHGA